MARTTPADVRMELEADGYPIEAITDDQIKTVGIMPATLEVDERLTDENGDSPLSDDRLTLIERYVAGHLILSSGVDELRQVDSEELSDESSVEYAGDRSSAGYGSTTLGDKALRADLTNTLGVVRRDVNVVRPTGENQ